MTDGPDLPVIKLVPRHGHHRSPTAVLATVGRCLLLLLLAIAIRWSAPHHVSTDGADARSLTLRQVQNFVTKAAAIDAAGPTGLQQVRDQHGELVGMVVQTLPAAERIIGYRGPSNVLLLLDEDLLVQRCELLSSADTPEHVAAVRADPNFFAQFRGWSLGQDADFPTVDATSGATLTALAIAEGVAVRLGGRKPSLRFPEELNDDDLRLIYDDRADLQLRIMRPGIAEVRKRTNGGVVGRLLRTGVWSDSIAGYQGPSELLVAVDRAGHVQRIRLRNTFDNPPYTDYLNEDDYFWRVFLHRGFDDLRQLDLQEQQVEGVSGATMTSLAVAETLVAAANDYHAEQQQPSTDRAADPAVRWTADDVGTLAVLAVGLLIGLTRLRGWPRLRWVWWVVLVGYFGLVTGNLISLVVVSGWTINGVAWRLAPGLVAVLAVSVLIPATTRRNVYCTHLCPHGAVQQMLRRTVRSRRRLPRRFHRWLRCVPGLILLLAGLTMVVGWNVNLASWEPFNAWVWYVSGWPSLVLAGLSLLAAVVIPMAWCRYGCATGRLLEYLRHSARAARWQPADIVLITLTLFAYGWLWWQTG